jgi:dihydrofolate reductase
VAAGAQDGRKLVVITRDKGPWPTDGVPGRTVPSTEALAIAERMPGEICVNGGERIFEEVLAMDGPCACT